MIGFRVDANETVATGHLMRCMAIAAACRKKGEQCLFLMAEDKESFRLRDRQFSYEILHSRWDVLEEELPAVKEVIERECLEWLVVDSYQVTADYLRQLNQMMPVMYIDDMARQCYPVSALLYYGLCPDLEQCRQRYRDTKTRILSGAAYIPLREEFTREHSLSEGETEREKSILITTGGTDPYHVTAELLALCLTQRGLEGYRYHVIVGSMNEDWDRLQKMAEENSRIHLHRNVTNISDYMRSCRMAVSAGGTTLFELCACGIPTVCFSFADNQKPGTVGMGAGNIMQYAGDARETDVAAGILERLLGLAQSRSLRREYSVRMEKLVDGRGAERIADVLCHRKS